MFGWLYWFGRQSTTPPPPSGSTGLLTSPGCCCGPGTCNLCFTIRGCLHTPITYSVTVTGPGGFSTTFTATDGVRICIAVPSSGTYTWVIAGGTYPTKTGTVTVTCPGTTEVDISLFNPICTGCCAGIVVLPDQLMITDANGTHVATAVEGALQLWRVDYHFVSEHGQAPAPYKFDPRCCVNYKATVEGCARHTIACSGSGPTRGFEITTRWSCGNYCIETDPRGICFGDNFPCSSQPADVGFPLGCGEGIPSPTGCFPNEYCGDRLCADPDCSKILSVPGCGTLFSGQIAVADFCKSSGVSVPCFGGVNPNFAPDYFGNPVIVSW